MKKILLGIFILVLAAAISFYAWGSTPAAPMAEAIAALGSDSAVIVQTDPWLTFQPAGRQARTGFIYYPGGRVDYRAYAPFARALAEQGILVVVVPMPLNLAVMAPNRAAEVIDAFPHIQQWSIGGHSLGGAMAARYAYQNANQISSVILIAAYPAESDRLREKDVQVLSISATQDGLATVEKIETSSALLPESTIFYAIEGGNHAQFGWYGEQQGDLPAQISREEQQSQAVGATIEFLKGLAGEEGR